MGPHGTEVYILNMQANEMKTINYKNSGDSTACTAPPSTDIIVNEERWR